MRENRRRHAIADERIRKMLSGTATPEEMAYWFRRSPGSKWTPPERAKPAGMAGSCGGNTTAAMDSAFADRAAINEGGTTMQATMEATTQASGSGLGVGRNGTALVIDDFKPVPAGTYVAAIRLMAMLGKGDHFTNNGKPDGFARSAWQWVVRLHDGSHGTVTHLVTLDDSYASHVRGLAAALAGFEGLLDEPNHCDARRIIGRSAMVEVLRQSCGKGRDRPYVATAWALPKGIRPVELADACVWYPGCGTPLPRYAPQWVRTYADGAVAHHWQGRKGAKP